MARKKKAAKRKTKKQKSTKRKATKTKAKKKKKVTKKKPARKAKAKKKKVSKKKKTTKKTTKKKTTKKKTKAKKKKPVRKTKTKAKKKKKTGGTRKKSKMVRLTNKRNSKAKSSSTSPISSGGRKMLNVGDLAPDFELQDQHGNNVSLSQFRGKKVVLYFYPKDDTPGCTREACSFRDHLSQFQGLNAETVGISFDDPETHQKFIDKYGLNFTLLSDTDKEVATSYGVYVQKNMYGKTYMGIERSTFVIDTEGRIAQVFRNVRVDGHTDEVITALEEAA